MSDWASEWIRKKRPKSLHQCELLRATNFYIFYAIRRICLPYFVSMHKYASLVAMRLLFNPWIAKLNFSIDSVPFWRNLFRNPFKSCFERLGEMILHCGIIWLCMIWVLFCSKAEVDERCKWFRRLLLIFRFWLFDESYLFQRNNTKRSFIKDSSTQGIVKHLQKNCVFISIWT